MSNRRQFMYKRSEVRDGTTTEKNSRENIVVGRKIHNNEEKAEVGRGNIV